MSKQMKVIVLVVFVFLLAFFAVTGFTKNAYTAEEIETNLASCIADELSEKKAPVKAEEIKIIALCENDKEKAFVFEKDGETLSGFAIKSLLLPRYQIVCGEMSSSDKMEENENIDLSETQNFRIKGYFEEHLYKYEDGEFTLESSAKRMNEEVKNGIIRAVCGVGIVLVTLFSKPKKEE